MRVFIHKYPQHPVCAMVCVDCIDPNTTEDTIGDNKKDPAPAFWELGRNILPTGKKYKAFTESRLLTNHFFLGFLWVLAASGTLPYMSMHIKYIDVGL